MDTYEGGADDTQNLHKYLYCQDDPIDGIDPSGMLVVIYTKIGHYLNVYTGKIGGKVIYVDLSKAFIDQLSALPDHSITEIDFLGHGSPIGQGISNEPDLKEAIWELPDETVVVQGASTNQKRTLLGDVLSKKMLRGSTIKLEGCSVAAKNQHPPPLANICQAVSKILPDVYVRGSTFTTRGDNRSLTAYSYAPFTLREYHTPSTISIAVPPSFGINVNTPTAFAY